MIRTEGALRLFHDLGVDPNSVEVLPLSYYFESPILGTISREGFVHCWLRLGVGRMSTDNLMEQEKEAVKGVMDSFYSDGPVVPPFDSVKSLTPSRYTTKKGLFATVYEFAFDFARNPSQRNLRMSPLCA